MIEHATFLLIETKFDNVIKVNSEFLKITYKLKYEEDKISSTVIK
jgi:hypothetical protein